MVINNGYTYYYTDNKQLIYWLLYRNYNNNYTDYYTVPITIMIINNNYTYYYTDNDNKQ